MPIGASRGDATTVVMCARSATDSTVDGNLAVVRGGENCLVVPPAAVGAFAAAVVRLRDAKLVSRLVAAGRETALEFSLERTIPSLEDLYRECAAEKLGVRTSS